MELEQLITLIQTVSDSKLTGLKYEEKGVKLHLTKQVQTVQAAELVLPESGQGQESVQNPEPVPSGESQEPGAEGELVNSPLVGTFYAAPAEDAQPFVKVGDSVTKGQTLAIVEAMKLMNEIESEYDGTVAEILAVNGEAVEYGQPLFRIV